MNEPSKIRVLYFDESMEVTSRFVSQCARRDIIELVAAFRSLSEMNEIFALDNYRSFSALAADVIVVGLANKEKRTLDALREIRRRGSHKLIGLLPKETLSDSSLRDYFDYCSEYPSVDGADEDKYTKIIYQIKTARLALHADKAGVKGKWAVLPYPPKARSTALIRLIAIGASAGGTAALTEIISELPNDLPPIVVVQHIPENFSHFFAGNLDAKVIPSVVVAQNGQQLLDGFVYLGGGDKHLEVERRDGGLYAKCTDGKKVSGHRPSVDVLFRSAAALGENALGVILTGMGSDGAQGLLAMRKAGAFTIGQDKETSQIYGMPLAAYELGAVTSQLPLSAIAKAIVKCVKN